MLWRCKMFCTFPRCDDVAKCFARVTTLSTNDHMNPCEYFGWGVEGRGWVNFHLSRVTFNTLLMLRSELSQVTFNTLLMLCSELSRVTFNTLLMLCSELSRVTFNTLLMLRSELSQVTFNTLLMLRSELSQVTFNTLLMLCSELSRVTFNTLLMLCSELSRVTFNTLLMLRSELSQVTFNTLLMLRSELCQETFDTFLIWCYSLNFLILKKYIAKELASKNSGNGDLNQKIRELGGAVWPRMVRLKRNLARWQSLASEKHHHTWLMVWYMGTQTNISTSVKSWKRFKSHAHNSQNIQHVGQVKTLRSQNPGKGAKAAEKSVKQRVRSVFGRRVFAFAVFHHGFWWSSILGSRTAYEPIVAYNDQLTEILNTARLSIPFRHFLW